MLTFPGAPAVSLQAGWAQAEYGRHLLTRRLEITQYGFLFP